MSLDWDLLAWCTGKGFSLQSDFYLAPDNKRACEAVGASQEGSIPLAPVQSIYPSQSIVLCYDLLIKFSTFDPLRQEIKAYIHLQYG